MTGLVTNPAFIRAAAERGFAPGPMRISGMAALPQHLHGEAARIAVWYF